MRKEAKPCQKGYFKLGSPESSENTRDTQEAAVTKSTDGGLHDTGSLCLGTDKSLLISLYKKKKLMVRCP